MTEEMVEFYIMLLLAVPVGIFLLVQSLKTLYHAIQDARAYLKERKELKWM